MIQPFLLRDGSARYIGGALTVLFLLVHFSSVAQGQEERSSSLNGAESRMLDALIDRFRPMSVVEQMWVGAFESAGLAGVALKSRVDSLERLDMVESELLIQVGALRQDMRTLREERNAFVAEFLSPLDRLALDSILSPPKPSIQHFGFHDRMKCLVCIKPGAPLGLPAGTPVPKLIKQ